MSQSKAVAESLKKILAQKGITYADLATRIGLSEAGIKKMFSKTTFTLERLEEICGAINVTFEDLFRTHQSLEKARKLSKAQEDELAIDEKLFIVFQQVLKGATAAKLHQRFRFSEVEVFRLLRKLDELGLIELHARNSIRLRVEKFVSWAKDGPLYEKYRAPLLTQFIDSQFRGENEFIDFLPIRTSSAVLQVVEAKLKKLVREIRDLTEFDYSTSEAPRESWIMLAMRDAEFYLYQKYARSRS